MERIYERVGGRLGLVLIAQYRNGTIAKKLTLEKLRKWGVMSTTPDFKSLGSALAALEDQMKLVVDRGEKKKKETEETNDGST